MTTRKMGVLHEVWVLSSAIIFKIYIYMYSVIITFYILYFSIINIIRYYNILYYIMYG